MRSKNWRRPKMDFRRSGVALVAVLCAAVMGAGPLWAGMPTSRQAASSGGTHRSTGPASVQRPNRIQTIDSARRMDANRLNMFVTNYGSFAWDLQDQGSPPGLL